MFYHVSDRKKGKFLHFGGLDHSMFNEDELILGCCKGDRTMQYALYERFSKTMFAICMRYSKGRQEAEDILQESFIKVFDHIKKFRKDASLESWIKKIVINTALNSQRNKLYLYPMVDVDHLKSEMEYEVVLGNYHYEDLLKMINDLPDGCRVIFNLYAIEGYQHNEVAKMLGISEGTSKSQYARAKNLMKKKLEEAEKIRYERFK